MTFCAEFIEIEKLTTTKNNQGIEVPDVKKESIRISHIQRYRAWHNKQGENIHVSGNITNVTLKSDLKEYDIKIAEDMDSFSKRLGPLSISLREDVSHNAEQRDKEADTKAS